MAGDIARAGGTVWGLKWRRNPKQVRTELERDVNGSVDD